LLTKSEDLINLEMLNSLLTKYDCMPLIMLDGFIAAIVSLDRVVMPGEWHKHVGIDQIEFANEAELKIFFALLNDFYNANIDELLERTYEPILIDENEGDFNISAKLWASGYILGLSLDGVEWLKQVPEDIFTMFMMLSAFSLPDKEAYAKFRKLFEKNAPEERVTELFQEIPNALAKFADDIYQFQLRKRSLHQTKHADNCGCPTHTVVRVGRNDPCPCGSGKKYKKCCLH